MALSADSPRAAAIVALLLGLAACGRGQAGGADTSRGAAAAASSAATHGASGERKPLCQRSGHWDSCLVKVRLEESGMVPQSGEPVADLPSLGPSPVVYHIGKAAIALYVFPDTVARARAARTLDPAKFIAPSAALSMKGEATAIQNDNLLALLFSLNDQQRERVSDAFMAGPPQP